MESRNTRRALRAFPPDLEFTQDPNDDLRKFLDIPGRQLKLASEYVNSQLSNSILSTADPNEPALIYTSGYVFPDDVVVSGNIKDYLQELTSMEVTGFEEETSFSLEGIPTGALLGITYTRVPDPSGRLHVSVSGYDYIYTYDYTDRTEVTESGVHGRLSQDFDVSEQDEYLIVEKENGSNTAVLKHTPAGDVIIIDTKNLAIPWAEELSDGIVAPSGDYELSGDTLTLVTPRPSYAPATLSGDVKIYPANYQPDQNWDSSYIAEYEYDTREAPYGLSMSEMSHHLGITGPVVGGSDELL